ncbi:sensor histidine kinase [Leucobacter celer]|uniref:sensor histidine kinase n=1 Tax=Leucobacter celer TaxID=668625 RepID=UPI0006A7CF63|nr:HAMP domain-containing sensor histidine kinase [Leucobacter celer]
MKRRVLFPLLVFGLLTVIAILVPAGEAIAQSRTQQIQLQRAGSIDQILQRAFAAVEHGNTVALSRYLERFHDTYGEAVLVVDGAGEVVASVGDVSLDDEVSAVLDAALRGVPQWTLPTVYPWSDTNRVMGEPLSSDGSAPDGAVALVVNQSAAKADVLASWMLAGAVGAALLAALLAASVYWTRWVVRPVLELDAAANALAEQREFEPADESGPPELRRLVHSFERMAQSVERTLEQQRGLVADAAHQLRNPLAAVRLRIDALSYPAPVRGRDTADDESAEPGAGDTAAVQITAVELAAIASDLDRLERDVDRMLVLANAEHRATAAAVRPGTPECVVSAASLIEPHRQLLAEAGVEVETFGAEEHLRCRRGDLEEIVENIVDNTRKYAAGSTLRIGFEPGAGPGADPGAGPGADPDADPGADPGAARTTLVISDSGSGLDDDDLARVGTRFWRSAAHRDQQGSGLGYAIIEQLAHANGATVAVDRAPEGGLRTSVRLRIA